MSSRPKFTSHRDPVVSRSAKRWSDGDVVFALALFWIVSVVRVVGAALQTEVFGAEATLALMAVFIIPWFAFRRERENAGGRHSQTLV